MIDYSFELMVFCFVADEEMFQGSQRFSEPKLRAFFNLYGHETEKKYLQNVVQQERFKLAGKKEKKRRQKKVAMKKKKKNVRSGMFYSDEEEESSEEEDNNGDDVGLNFMSIINKAKVNHDEQMALE